MKGLNLVVGLALATVAGIAAAAVPASVETSFTTMSADFNTVFGYAFTALTVIVTAMIAWRYTRKLASKL